MIPLFKCDTCGKNLPLTMFSVDRITQVRRTTCRDCRKRLFNLSKQAGGDGNRYTHWTKEDYEVLRSSEGRRTIDVAVQLGRSRSSVIGKLPKVGLHSSYGTIVRLGSSAVDVPAKP